MDEDRLLRDVLAQPGAPHPDTIADARAKLDRLAHNEVRGTTAKLRIAITVAVAAAGVVGASLVPNLIPPRVDPPDSVSAVRSAPTKPAAAPPTAQQVLHTAANREATLAKPTGTSWRTRVLSVSRVAIEQAKVPYSLEIRELTEHWSSAPAYKPWGATGVVTLAIRPPSGADAKAYEQDGSPTAFKLPTGDSQTVRVYQTPDEGMMLDTTSENALLGDDLVGLDAMSLRKLPTQPKQLGDVLLEMRNERSTEDSDTWLVGALGWILLDTPVQPAVRGAAFKLLAILPGVTVDGAATDVLGRTGVAVGQADSQLIIEPATGRLLGLHTEQAKLAVESTGWTDDKPQPPKATR